MIIELSYEEARRQYPDRVDEVMTKLRKGKSRHRDAAPEELEWSIEYGVLVPGQLVTFADLIVGRVEDPRERRSRMSLDERVEEIVQGVTAYLRGKIGRFIAFSSQIEGCPEEVRAAIRRGVEEDMAEEARVAALSPEERQAEAEEALRQLRKCPGSWRYGSAMMSRPRSSMDSLRCFRSPSRMSLLARGSTDCTDLGDQQKGDLRSREQKAHTLTVCFPCPAP